MKQALQATELTVIDRRAELLTRAVRHVLSEGLSDLSLRPLAAALGTSARMLVYYFGSKEQLVLDVLNEVRQAKHRELRARASEGSLREYWRWASSDEGLRYLRLVYEVYGLSLRDPKRFGSFLADETAEEVAFIESMLIDAGLPARSLAALSTYTFAALRGLELDLLATGEHARVDAAFDMAEDDLKQRTLAMAAEHRTNGGAIT